MDTTETVVHPNLEWCKDILRKNKGDRITESDLRTVWWDGIMKCYLVMWSGMTLGIETDGHIHS